MGEVPFHAKWAAGFQGPVFDTMRRTHLRAKPNKEKLAPSHSECKFSLVHTLFQLIGLLLRVEIPPTGNQMSLQNYLSNLVRSQFIFLAGKKKYLFPTGYFTEPAFFNTQFYLGMLLFPEFILNRYIYMHGC